MTSKEPKEPGEGQGGTRKPRGMGGVILILALLMALFLVVSSSARECQNSLHAFYSHLFNGRVEKTSWSDGVCTAEVRLPDRALTMEVVLRENLRTSEGELDLISTLQTQRLDASLYPAATATSRFLDDLAKKQIRPLRAFLNRPDHLTRSASELERWSQTVTLSEASPLDPALPVVRIEGAGPSHTALLTDAAHGAAVSAAIRAMVEELR